MMMFALHVPNAECADRLALWFEIHILVDRMQQGALAAIPVVYISSQQSRPLVNQRPSQN